MPELKRNILNFGYGVNFKYEGMLSHSFDRFYVVAKFGIPKLEDLKLTMIAFDPKCSYLSGTNMYIDRVLKYCKKIVPHVKLYKRQIAYYNRTANKSLENEIGLILPNFPTDNRPKRGAILASVLGGIVYSIIGLAYKGIPSFLHHKRHQALHKAVKVMEKKTDLQQNKMHHLEDTMIMYGAYNSDPLKDLIDTVHRMHNSALGKKRPFQAISIN